MPFHGLQPRKTLNGIFYCIIIYNKRQLHYQHFTTEELFMVLKGIHIYTN